VTFKSSAALRKLLGRAARRNGRTVRRPVVTVTEAAGGPAATVRGRIVVKRR
jgi:hypothetical protein